MRVRDVASFLTFAAILVFGFGYFGTLGIRVNPPAQRTNLTMDVADINGLVAGSNVLLRGVPVGKVTDTSTSVKSATIDFYIEAPYRIPLDSEIRLENLSALGESYIGLVPRQDAGPMLQNGQHIATEKVTQPPSISQLATSVVRVLEQLDPHALQRIIDETYTALPDPTTVLPNITRASIMLRNSVADYRGAGRAVLDNFQFLLEHAEYVAPALTGITPDLRESAVWLQDLIKHIPILIHEGNPGDVTNFNRFIKRVKDFLDERSPDLKVLGEAFQPKFNAIAAALMNFDTAQILDNMLAAVPADGTITLRVVP